LLLIGVALLVLVSTLQRSRLGYGIAVSTPWSRRYHGFVVIWKLWNWRAASAAAIILPLVVVDTTFFSANLLKLLEGRLGASCCFGAVPWR